MLMKWYGDPIDDCRVSPAEEMPELADSRDLDRIEEAIRNRKRHKKLIQRDILLVRTLRYTGIRRAEAAHLRAGDIDRLAESQPKLEALGVAGPSHKPLLDEVHWACQKYVQSQLDQLLHPPRHKFSWELQEGEQPSQEGLITAINRSY